MATHEMLAHFIITLEGKNAPDEMYDDLAEVTVETNWHLPGMFSFRLHDREVRWMESSQLAVGTAVEISAREEGAASSTTLISGEITALEPEFTQAMPVLQVRGYDRGHRLHRGRRRRAFVKETDASIAKAIAQDAGLEFELGSTSEHEYVYQNNLTNWEFLQERAHRIGFGCYVEGDTLYFKEPAVSETPIELEWGMNLETFYPRLSSSAQVKEVIVRGWDPKTKREIIGQASDGNVQPEIGESKPGGQASESAFEPRLNAQMVITDRPVSSQDEADRMAQSIADELSGTYIRADGEGEGNPNIRAGCRVNITGVGKRFGGEYLVTRAVHYYLAEKPFRTRFSVTGRRPVSLGTLLTEDIGPSHSRLPGVVVGVVENNKDPDDMGRIKVKFPWLADDAVSYWARLSSPMAGKGRGLFYLPEVNDEVLVAFEHNDINYPYIIGALWNGQDKPPAVASEIVSADGKVYQRIIKTREGHLIILDDSPSEPGIIIIDKTGNNRIEIDSSQNKITLQAQMDLTIEAKGKVQINGQMGVEIKSSANVDVQGTGQVNVKGSVINLN